MPLCGLHPRATARQRQGTGSNARAFDLLEFATCRTSADSDDAKQDDRATLSTGETPSDDADLDALRRFRTTTNRTIDRLCSRFAAYIGQSQRAKSHRRRNRGFARLSPEERAHRVHGRDDSPGAVWLTSSPEDNIRGNEGGAFWRDNPGHLAEIGRRAGAPNWATANPSRPRRQAEGQRDAHND